MPAVGAGAMPMAAAFPGVNAGGPVNDLAMPAVGAGAMPMAAAFPGVNAGGPVNDLAMPAVGAGAMPMAAAFPGVNAGGPVNDLAMPAVGAGAMPMAAAFPGVNAGGPVNDLAMPAVGAGAMPMAAAFPGVNAGGPVNDLAMPAVGAGAMPMAAAFPGVNAGGPVNDLAMPAVGAGAMPMAAAFPGVNAGGPVNDLATTPPLAGLTTNPIAPAGADEMPFLPFAPGGAGAGNAMDATGPSDASGLLAPSDKPFTSAARLGDLGDGMPVAGVPAGGGSLLGSDGNPIAPAGADEMPFLPFAPGGAGAGNAMDATGPSDASGLLAPSDKPFTSAARLGDLGDGMPVAGVPAGGGSLLGSDGNPIAPAGADEMPFLPFAPGGAGAGNAMDATGPSDASGLLAPSAEPFTPDEWQGDLGDGIPAADAAGTPAGSEVLLGSDGNPITPLIDTTAEGASYLPDTPGLFLSDEQAGTEPGAAPDPLWPVDNDAVPGAMSGAGFAPSGTKETDAPTTHGTGDERKDGLSTSDPAAQPPPDRVAVVSVPDTPDDIRAWDISTDAASLFLLSGFGRGQVEEEAGPISRFSTEEAAWVDPVPGDPDETPEDAGLVTWRRPPAGEVQAPVELRSSPVELRSSPAPADDEEVAAATSTLGAAEDEEEGENETSHGIADLLVQEAALWGTWPDDPGVL